VFSVSLLCVLCGKFFIFLSEPKTVIWKIPPFFLDFIIIMRYYPINLDIKNRICLVVGGGEVATRKVTMLLRCGAEVTVISPQVTDELKELSRNGKIILKEQAYQHTDLNENIFLVFAATDNAEINRQVQNDAENLRILCNIADNPEISHFTLPAVVHQGDLILSISTSGKSPALSRIIRRELEQNFGPEYAECLEILGNIRENLLKKGHDPEAHRKLFRSVLDKGLIKMIKAEDSAGVQALLTEVFGAGTE